MNRLQKMLNNRNLNIEGQTRKTVCRKTRLLCSWDTMTVKSMLECCNEMDDKSWFEMEDNGEYSSSMNLYTPSVVL